MHWKRTYAGLYHRVYGMSRRSDATVNTFLQHHLRSTQPADLRVVLCRNLLTLCRTQRLGARVDHRTLTLTRRTLALGRLILTDRARRIQRVAVRRLWRPCGPLMWREATHHLSSMLTSTPGGEDCRAPTGAPPPPAGSCGAAAAPAPGPGPCTAPETASRRGDAAG